MALTGMALAAPASASAAASCPISYGATDDAKPNKLYLYYPLAADGTFPEYGGVGCERPRRSIPSTSAS